MSVHYLSSDSATIDKINELCHDANQACTITKHTVQADATCTFDSSTTWNSNCGTVIPDTEIVFDQSEYSLETTQQDLNTHLIDKGYIFNDTKTRLHSYTRKAQLELNSTTIDLTDPNNYLPSMDGINASVYTTLGNPDLITYNTKVDVQPASLRTSVNSTIGSTFQTNLDTSIRSLMQNEQYSEVAGSAGSDQYRLQFTKLQQLQFYKVTIA